MYAVPLTQYFGTRARLLGLVSLAVLPLFGLLVASALHDRNAALESARREAVEQARLVAERQAKTFSQAHGLLMALLRTPGVTLAGGEACASVLRPIAAGQRQFLTIGVVDPQGQIVCHSSTGVAGAAFGDRALFDVVTNPAAGAFQIGGFMIGRISKKPTVAVAMRLTAEDGRIGMAFASLNLSSLGASAEGLENGFRSVTAIELGSGTVISHVEPGQPLVGAVFHDHPLVQAMRARPWGGVFEGEGLDGEEEVTGFAPLPRTDGPVSMVAVALSRADILSAVDARAAASLATALAAGLVALGLAWWVGLRTQIRPIGELAKTARAIGYGDFSARATMEPWQAPELLFLGGSLNEMAQKLAEADAFLRQSEARFRILAENTADMVTRFDADGRRVFASDACRELIGCEPEDLIGGRLWDLAHEDDAPALRDMLKRVISGEPAPVTQYRLRRKDGHHIWVEAIGRPVLADNGAVFAVRDITRRKLAEDQLAEANHRLRALAAHDGLTGLANRRSFDEVFEREFARAAREGGPIALLMADVDRFKAYNDTYGHPSGDEVLKQVASALRRATRRPADFVARYGGEEFTAVLPATELEGALKVAQSFRAAVADDAVPHTGSTFGVVTVSVGVAVVWPRAEDARADLLRMADEALYAAKGAGRNRVRTLSKDPPLAVKPPARSA